MSRHTPGPWKVERMTAGAFVAITANSKPRSIGTVMDRPDGSLDANARLLAAAPAMDIVLRMLSLGIARIERSATAPLVEFCFNGMRYSVGGDWNGTVGVIGWDRCRAVIAKAEAQ